MLNNKREEKFRHWQELVSKFESRSISSTEFCKLAQMVGTCDSGNEEQKNLITKGF